MKKEERSGVAEAIRIALLDLLKTRDYSEVFMTEIAKKAHVGRRTLYRYFPTKDDIMRYEADILMDEFAKKVLDLKSVGLEKTMYAWFTFWEEYIDSLLLLKKTHLLYFIEDNLPQLIMKVALMTKYRGMDIDLDAAVAAAPVSELYEFYFELAGIWKLTILWAADKERTSPEEMSQIVVKIWEH